MERLTTNRALHQLSQATGKEFISLFRHGTLEIEVYKPHLVDLRSRIHATKSTWLFPGLNISSTGRIVHRFSPARYSLSLRALNTVSKTSLLIFLRGSSSLVRREEKWAQASQTVQQMNDDSRRLVCCFPNSGSD